MFQKETDAGHEVNSNRGIASNFPKTGEISLVCLFPHFFRTSQRFHTIHKDRTEMRTVWNTEMIRNLTRPKSPAGTELPSIRADPMFDTEGKFTRFLVPAERCLYSNNVHKQQTSSYRGHFLEVGSGA